MAEVDPDQDAALRRLRAAFGFVEILHIIDHEPGPEHDEITEESEQAPPSSGG